jgi:molecular chaperone DnaK
MKSVLGIDLGTTKSVVGVWDGEKPCILPSQFGGKSMPSLVMVTPEEEIYAGFQAARHPDRYNSKNITISSVKRMMGSKGETGWGWWRSYPQEVSSFIISELRQQAEQVLGSEVNQAVIAIPSHFDEAQRRATKEAATIAGIEVLRLLNEATAAILAYGNTRKNDGTVVVFDLGGGTLDVSVADLGGGVVNVKTIEGDSHLGGDDFTQAIIDHATETIRQDNGTETANIAV